MTTQTNISNQLSLKTITIITDRFLNLSLLNLIYIFFHSTATALPIPLHETGPRILFIKFGIYPTDKYPLKDIIAITYAQQEIWMLEDDNAVVNGYIDVIDASRVTPAHFAQFTVSIIRKMVVFAKRGVPLRQCATHFFNVPAGFDKLYNIIKNILPAKQQDRVSMHKIINMWKMCMCFVKIIFVTFQKTDFFTWQQFGVSVCSYTTKIFSQTIWR